MAERNPELSEQTNEQGGITARFADFLVRHRFRVNLVVHNLLFALALLMAYLVWFEAATVAGRHRRWFTQVYLLQLPFFLLGKSIIFGWLKLFRAGWQHASIRDLWNILLGSWLFLLVAYLTVLVFVFIPKWMLKEPLFDHSDGILVLDFMATVFLVGTARLGVRLYYEELRPVSGEGVRRVLVVGAGNAAEALLREIHRMRVERYRVIGLVDDDPAKRGVFIHGVPVLGSTDDLKEICDDHRIDEILIAVPSATQKQLRQIIEKCRGTKLNFQTLPSMDALIDGRVTVSQIRKVRIEDLLGREAVQLDSEAVASFVNGRRVLVTGAGGSIGAEMCRQVCLFGPAALALVDQAENNLFSITNELHQNFRELRTVPLICDVYDRDRVMYLFEQQRPEVVIHAAAHKHVPLMELNPCEAIKNNIFGTRNVADAAVRFGTREFVLISTDKAVNPSSIMGCSKRIAEIYTQALNGRQGGVPRFKSVRFGNVLGSAGSVVPTFEEQIRRGGPVTVTHPEMTRYFMTIPEASQLVLQAAAVGTGGEIFLLDMGEPVKIVDLARDMITLSGLRVGEDIDIAFTGIRPGEKLFEELRKEGEDIAPTTHPKVKIWRHRVIEWNRILAVLDELSALVNCPDQDPIIAAMRRLVPEYQPHRLAETGPPVGRPGPATKGTVPSSLH